MQPTLNFRFVRPIFLKKTSMNPIKSPRVMFSSATTPSTWWNSARCVASTVSFLKTLSMLNILQGRNPPGWLAISYSMAADVAVVCVRRTSLDVSLSRQGYRYPMDPNSPPSSCTDFTFARYSRLRVSAVAGSGWAIRTQVSRQIRSTPRQK